MFQFAELQFRMAYELSYPILVCPGRNALHHAVFQHLCRRFLDCLRLLRGASWLFFQQKKTCHRWRSAGEREETEPS